MSSHPFYVLHDVQALYSSGFMLDISELAIPRGDALGLVGPTGAGKSTLLRILAGLQEVASGEVSFEGERFEASRLALATRRRITLVSQRPVLLSGSVRYNLEFGLRLRGIRPGPRVIDETIEQWRLTSLSGRSVRTLSGGQAQLVALARAAAFQPEVLLLDEPTAHLDPGHVAVVEENLRALHAQGMTLIWATHNLFQARRVTSRTAFLWDGRLVEVASTSEFFGSPADPRTKDFVDGRLVY